MEGQRKYLKLPMEKRLYDRSYCKRLAASIINEGKITGMTVSQLYIEIFAHAYVFYNFHLLPNRFQNHRLFKSIYTSASDGVDLEDNGDRLIRRIVYVIIWFLPAFPVKE